MTETRRRVLLIEDDAEIREVVSSLLSTDDIHSEFAADGVAGLEAARNGGFDLIILDMKLPGMNGIEVCRELKLSRPELPVIILSSLGDEIDRVVGLEIGADDYIVKPFSPREFLARVRTRLRARQASQGATRSDSEDLLLIGDLRIDCLRRTVSTNDSPIELTAKEFDVILFLASQAGKPFTKDDLLREVWGITAGFYDDSVTSLISRLRKKIEPNPSVPVYLLTVRGVGYRFAEPREFQKQPSRTDGE